MPSQYLHTISTLYQLPECSISCYFTTCPYFFTGCAGYVVGCAGYVVWVAQAMWWVDSDYTANLSPAKLGLRLSLAIKEGSKYLPNTYKVFPLYTHYQNFQIESISLLFHILSRVAQAMCWVAQAMCWVAQAMLSGLRRLCGVGVVGLCENIAISAQLG